MNNSVKITNEEATAELQRFIVIVYGWMSLALFVTGLVAIWTASNPDLIKIIIGNSFVFIALIVTEFILVAYLVGWIMKMSSQTATFIFILYSILNGLTLSVIFLAFTKESLASTFFVTAGTFAIMSIYGYFTKTDLTRLGNLFLMGLIGLILATILNMFYQNETLYWITTYLGILIFVGLIAYDTQKIKKIHIMGYEGTDEEKKEAIIGALSLYLDFINLFLMILRLMGRRK